MTSKNNDAQRAATSRYRERNKAELQLKARQRMAKRRAELKKSEEAWAAYTARARQDNARYRESNREKLAENERVRRGRRCIDKRGFEAWHKAYLKRHPPPPPAPQEDLPEWPESSDSEHERETDPDASDIPPPPPESASYNEQLNYFLDHLDPTTKPGYVPKPGQEPYFRRGKQRWH
ncbi:hypothetical protein C8F04DRAFT_1179504 [Mycena alexandri]|uniref:Uncharacterized protein n=1 Tax=Mycena alexandri TaxID=1745969 RepID=A0AAD6T358_9AGAR|nr:hypothetical protein C8F04DRAFT_1179504 [Mycena alexandri]